MREQQPKESFFTRAMIPIVTSRAGASFFRKVMLGTSCLSSNLIGRRDRR